MYNLRLYYSNMRRNEHGFGRWDMVWGPDGGEKTQTDRNPDNFKYRNNLFHHTTYELRHIYGDALYQIMHRRHRLYDNFNKYVIPVGLASLYILSPQHIFFTNFFVFSFFASISRVLSKTEEPKLDEVWLYDLVLNHEVLKQHLKMDSFHVIDFNMEYDRDASNPLFPAYQTALARFFNTDNNCTSGYMKLGDLETGSVVTLNFKTMPTSSNQFFYSDPFLIYDMNAEINANGSVDTIQVIKPEEVLKTKQIFVPLF
eukprot:CAMPEP_0170518488 /NCGR_PEP_ID=MMETSP0209-20121228/4168_1 /TAXON_ID=665100 ORGANISM="Litonotus pictus, Strain P1" /NCGR_SAMPLE_ID=MMETSP0209 /ASSEMBLY_ACC=CAM_ASM_000301 /LENGTH=256 /DNA_ID=CAMNT_0010804065 /DNA_START=68 /DNA_END=838 /DNA_ORIENTATION=-